MSHLSAITSTATETRPSSSYRTASNVTGPSSTEGLGHQPLTSRPGSMLRASLTISDESKPSTTSSPHPITQTTGSTWPIEGASGYQMTDHHAFHDVQRSALLMGNKYAGDNVRSHAPPQPSSSPRNPEREIIERTRKDEASGSGGGGSASTASSGIGSESPGKNSPGIVRGSSETEQWLAQIGTSHHTRPVVTVGVTLSDAINQAQLVQSSATDPKHYYSSKDVVYAATSVSPVTLSSLQYSTQTTPSTVQLTTVASYSPYLSPYTLPYVGYPPSALTPGGIESYSAMLASMGNQVQQAQAHIPSSPFLTPGALAIQSPYPALGIPGLAPGLTPAAAAGSAKGSITQSANSAVAYIGGHVVPTPSLLPTSHALTSSLLSTGLTTAHLPGTSFKTEESSKLDIEQQRHDQELKRYMESSIKHGGPREARVSPFERRTSPKLEQGHTGRDSGVPESPRLPNMDLSPSGKVDLRQQYYREISTVKQEPGGDGHAQSYLTSSRTEPGGDGHAQSYLTSSRTDGQHLYREHTRSTEGMRTQNYSKSILSRTPPLASPIPATLHMSSRLAPSRQSPQTGLVLSPAPQVRPTPTISSSSQPRQGESIQQDLNIPVQTKLESHRYGSTVHIATAQQRHHTVGSDQSSGQVGQSTVTNVPSYFTRGSIIQLANGELRRVEDLRTEDFVQSAELTEGLKIDSSTVLRVEEDPRRGVAHIGFLVGEQKAQVTVEAPMEHPFFVFGQGWSAVQPDRSLKSYALTCHHLSVGDVCISLTVKENGRPAVPKERVLENVPIGRDFGREPEVKRIRTEISLRQSPMEKISTPPIAQSAYHRQTIESALPSNHIPGYQGQFASPHSSSYIDSGTSHIAEQPQTLSKINERVEIDKNANTVVIQSSASDKQSPHMKVSEQQIARPLKRRWSDPVQAADPSHQMDTLPNPVHPDSLVKQSDGQ